MKEEFYKPSEIKYNSAQVKWLLRNVLFRDNWPSDHKETGYSGGKGHTVGHHANFETTRMIIGELSARLRMCGKAGLYLEYITIIDYEDSNYLIDRLSFYNGSTPREIAYLLNMAMRYCCGKKRKQVTFEKFCIYTKSRDNKRRRSQSPSGVEE